MPTRTRTVETYNSDAEKVDEQTVTYEVSQEDSNAEVLEDRLGAALSQLRAFVATPKPGTAAAQASAAYDATVLLAKIAVGLVRLRLRRLDTID